jgi:hypothetical protein
MHSAAAPVWVICAARTACQLALMAAAPWARVRFCGPGDRRLDREGERGAEDVLITGVYGAGRSPVAAATGIQPLVLAYFVRDDGLPQGVRQALGLPLRTVRLRVPLAEIGPRLASDVTSGRRDHLQQAAASSLSSTTTGTLPRPSPGRIRPSLSVPVLAPQSAGASVAARSLYQSSDVRVNAAPEGAYLISIPAATLTAAGVPIPLGPAAAQEQPQPVIDDMQQAVAYQHAVTTEQRSTWPSANAARTDLPDGRLRVGDTLKPDRG